MNSEGNGPREENTSTISERDFQEITSKVENVLSKRIKETNDSQKEIMKILAEMKNQISAPQIRASQVNGTGENSENLPGFSGNLIDQSFELETNQRANVSAVSGDCNNKCIITFITWWRIIADNTK